MADDIDNESLWKRHFHWKVLLRWGILGWILAAFLAIAGLLLTFNQYFGANVCFLFTAVFVFSKTVQIAVTSSARPWDRVFFTFVIFGLVGVGIVETIRGVNRWARQHEVYDRSSQNQPREKQKPSAPISKSSSFSTIVPVQTVQVGRPVRRIPFDENVDDPRIDFYRDLVLLSQRPFENPPGITFKEVSLADETVARTFLAKLLQYYILRRIRELQHGTLGFTVTTFLGRPKAEAQPIEVPPVPVPDPVPYSIRNLFRALEGNEFLNVYSSSESTKDGIETPHWQQIERTYWRSHKHPFQVPRGTTISLSGNDTGPQRDVQFERQGFYKLKFSVIPTFGAKNSVPKGFSTSLPGVDSYDCRIVMNYEIQQRADDGFAPNLYAQWAENLFAGLRTAMAP